MAVKFSETNISPILESDGIQVPIISLDINIDRSMANSILADITWSTSGEDINLSKLKEYINERYPPRYENTCILKTEEFNKLYSVENCKIDIRENGYIVEVGFEDIEYIGDLGDRIMLTGYKEPETYQKNRFRID